MNDHKNTIPPLSCPIDPSKWLCQLEADWSIEIPRLVDAGAYVLSTEGAASTDGKKACEERFRLEAGGRLVVRKGYATDGCSVIGNKIIAGSLAGCVVHDALRQAATIDPENAPCSSFESDIVFLEVLKTYGVPWILRWVMFIAVAPPIGSIYSLYKKLTDPPTDVVCSDKRSY